MKRLTLTSDQIATVITAMALAYDDCTIAAELYEDSHSFGVYEVVPVGRVDGLRRQEARTLISNEGLAHDAVRRMVEARIAQLTGETA